MDSVLSDAAFWHRLQFGFTLVYHYLFPQLTMGLAWFLVYWKWKAYRTGEEKYNQAARFWAKIFGVNFAVGVVTGIPMEFQFGTNWADFSRYAGSVIGQTLAMEGMFAFFLESAFVGALIWGEKRLGPHKSFLAAVAVALGSCLPLILFSLRMLSCSIRLVMELLMTVRSASPTLGPTCRIHEIGRAHV